MKILLLGEYSRLHNSLKEGLQSLGHDVVLAGSGDYFKNYPVDIKFKHRCTKGFSLFLKKIIYRLLSIDLKSLDIKKQFESYKDQFVGYDAVQLINENTFNTVPKIETQLQKFIFDNNNNVFLLSCGCDYPSVKYANDKKFKYSILTPYFKGKGSKKQYLHAFMYLDEPFKNLHEFVYSNIKGVIASDLDYHLPLIHHKKYLKLIPNPINTDKLNFIDLKTDEKIVIFHGINKNNYYKKGNDLFDKALKIIGDKYLNQVEIISTSNLPYNEYIKTYDRAHILLDQVYAYDQGYNALEAMAKGKVVFTGAEQEWLDYYNLKEDTVAINALPDTDKIVEKLEWLICHPEKIKEISKNARAFIEKEHDYKKIAKQYLDVYLS